MKSIKTFVAVIALATSFGSFAAQSVTATDTTLSGAEAKIAAQAQQAGASSYKITEAYTGGQVHMTAELNK
ncbi:YdgH/BhsA/McbA-like domain containing protein [Enterobacter sp.]|uniref:YdgH/BhsA/McbA-like domain containing protein n=1 Tax=Enterobacter sp. TaxID=42895 RepID=UPI00296E719C|nr:YdgH/BhsA/McbA-like domain containing protein [Enterobacter sp.]